MYSRRGLADWRTQAEEWLHDRRGAGTGEIDCPWSSLNYNPYDSVADSKAAVHRHPCRGYAVYTLQCSAWLHNSLLSEVSQEDPPNNRKQSFALLHTNLSIFVTRECAIPRFLNLGSAPKAKTNVQYQDRVCVKSCSCWASAPSRETSLSIVMSPCRHVLPPRVCRIMYLNHCTHLHSCYYSSHLLFLDTKPYLKPNGQGWLLLPLVRGSAN